MKLDIGTIIAEDGWESVDIDPIADYCALMWELPFLDASIEEIVTSHALEHVSKSQVALTLREWYRVLQPGSRLTIRVPDLAFCCAQYLKTLATESEEDPSIGWNLDMLFGNQEHPGQFHKTGFTKKSLTWYVQQAGFVLESVGTIWSHNQETIELQARKQ